MITIIVKGPQGSGKTTLMNQLELAGWGGKTLRVFRNMDATSEKVPKCWEEKFDVVILEMTMGWKIKPLTKGMKYYKAVQASIKKHKAGKLKRYPLK